MFIQTAISVYEVTINHPGERNGQGESLKTVMAQSKISGRTFFIDTYENPVTQEEMVDFLQDHDL